MSRLADDYVVVEIVGGPPREDLTVALGALPDRPLRLDCLGSGVLRLPTTSIGMVETIEVRLNNEMLLSGNLPSEPSRNFWESQ